MRYPAAALVWAAVVQETSSDEASRGTANGRHGNPGVQETRRGCGECCPAPGVPQVGARQDEQVAVGGIEIIEDHLRHYAEPTHAGDRLARLSNRDDLPRAIGETAGT